MTWFAHRVAGARDALRGRLRGEPADRPFESGRYWEQRYRSGGNSGAGSCGRLAEFKAEIVNGFVAANAVESVIEFGSGDGTQLESANYPSYVGVDVSRTALAATRRKFRDDPSKRFLHASEVTDGDRADLTLSLDVVFHLVEDEVFDGYMRRLFDSARKYVVIYSSDIDQTWGPHVRHRQFTRWVDANRPDFRLLRKVSNRYPYDAADPHNTSFADFHLYERVSKDVSPSG